MKLQKEIAKLGSNASVKLAGEVAEDLGMSWGGGIFHVFQVIANDPSRVPANIGSKHDDARAGIEKWFQRYKNGQDGCSSKRISKLSGTVADPIIETIIGARIPSLDEKQLERVRYAHRLAMSAENILGLMLEEHLAISLEPHGWYCAWGETVRSVDFVHRDGRLLQIKNRSNSENSSSSSVRKGTEIQKWYRIKADRVEYQWHKLNSVCKTSHLSEDSFVRFVRKTITANPACYAVETGNPWK